MITDQSQTLNLVLQVVTIAADLSKEEVPAQVVKEAVDKLGGDLLELAHLDHNYQILMIALFCLLGLDVLKNKTLALIGPLGILFGWY